MVAMTGSVFVPSEPLVSTPALLAASDDQLAVTIGLLVEEQQRRAVAGGDLGALAAEGFAGGFDSKGVAKVPYLRGGLLVCPGSKSERSKSSHDCVFTSVAGCWVWEHPDAVFDEMRQLPGVKVVRQSVTIVPAFEGLEFDVVCSQARSGPCEMRTARSFAVREGRLVETKTRSRPPAGHR